MCPLPNGSLPHSDTHQHAQHVHHHQQQQPQQQQQQQQQQQHCQPQQQRQETQGDEQQGGTIEWQWPLHGSVRLQHYGAAACKSQIRTFACTQCAVRLGLARTVYIYTVYGQILGDFPAQVTVYSPYICGSGQPYVQCHLTAASAQQQGLVCTLLCTHCAVHCDLMAASKQQRGLVCTLSCIRCAVHCIVMAAYNSQQVLFQACFVCLEGLLFPTYTYS